MLDPPMAPIKKVMKWDNGSENSKEVVDKATPGVDSQEFRECLQEVNIEQGGSDYKSQQRRQQ